MGKLRQGWRSRDFACAVWVALCFALTSAVYLSWLDRLLPFSDSAVADRLSMVDGYLFQAAGMGLVALWLRRRPEASLQRPFAAAAVLFAAVSAPSLLADSLAGVAIFGLLMNLLCGVIAGLYLCAIGMSVDAGRRSLVFGGGYALATVAAGLFSLIRGELLNRAYALLVYIPAALLLIPLTKRLGLLETRKEAEPAEPARKAPLLLACGVVALLSAVKNLGFVFPSADISVGLVPELSRLPYALGLAMAGFINDKNRGNGMICTVAALIIPFIMLGLASEPVPAAICWGLDYLFYGFFSVFRAVLLIDIAGRARRRELLPLGLLTGRVGDAAGTAISLLLGARKLWLIVLAAALFFPTVFLCLRLYRRLYEPQAQRQRSEQEVFEAFCLHNDLSAREREVFRMIIDNRSNGEIAEALFITQSTVKYHVRNVLGKAGCKNRSELQRKYALALYPHLENDESEKK